MRSVRYSHRETSRVPDWNLLRLRRITAHYSVFYIFKSYAEKLGGLLVNDDKVVNKIFVILGKL